VRARNVHAVAGYWHLLTFQLQPRLEAHTTRIPKMTDRYLHKIPNRSDGVITDEALDCS